MRDHSEFFLCSNGALLIAQVVSQLKKIGIFAESFTNLDLVNWRKYLLANSKCCEILWKWAGHISWHGFKFCGTQRTAMATFMLYMLCI